MLPVPDFRFIDALGEAVAVTLSLLGSAVPVGGTIVRWEVLLFALGLCSLVVLFPFRVV